MIIRFSLICCLLLVLSGHAPASPRVVQSLIVEFPSSGRVIVQAREEVGRFPQMLFISERTGKVLLLRSIKDKDKWLIPEKEDHSNPPQLRFRVFRSSGFDCPMIMSVGIYHGGSDNAFYLTIFGEVQGKVRCLNERPFFANIQGGYYLGFLNSKMGYGLAVWNFIWGNSFGEAHYSNHKYEIEVYKLEGDQFSRAIRRISRRMYGGNGSASLREIGIRGVDQRKGVPVIKDCLD